MGEGEAQGQYQSSVAAPIILLIVFAFHFFSRWLEQLKKRGMRSDKELQLRREIKQLLKEASSFSQPSTFAQGAKLKRLATAKEKELANYQELQSKEIKMSYDLYLKVLRIVKVVTYFMLIYWFWRAPVAAISQQLVQPFGKFLSFRTGGLSNNSVMVGIIPWLILSTRVSKFVCGLFK
ncbi:tail-anchored protein insertion receptor WRB-like [Melia azedarach]|uniref:Tail-anchored protein insertion receptor WRB-like n=1 Tax=Melia azedarach TaxID=155640 RepID=A0ACC1XRE1_MELAZ|nr:tail-anchored protein insertion receptor WRB-like [Melia azedarach]